MKPPTPTEMDYTPPTPTEMDYTLACCLLLGDEDGNFPSQNTSPTEKEAREALAKILRSGDVPYGYLDVLADAICPTNGSSFRRIEFKNPSQGHPRDFAHYRIASRVSALRKKGEKNAIGKVAKQVGMTTRHVSRIYSKHRERFERVERLRGHFNFREDDTSS